MTDVDARILGAVGLATKAGKCAAGSELCLREIRDGHAKLLILAGDVGENSRKMFIDKALFYHVPYVLCDADKRDFADRVGKKNETNCFVITDEGFVKVIRQTGKAIHNTNSEV